jgi:hypothetical protein
MHYRSRCQVQTEILVSKPDESANIVCVNLPASTASDRDQYDANTRVVTELLYSATAVLWLYFAIDPD